MRVVETIRRPAKDWLPSVWSPCQWLLTRTAGSRPVEPLRVGTQTGGELEAEGGIEDDRLVARVDDRGVADRGPVVVDDRRPDAVGDFVQVVLHPSRALRSEPT